MLHFELQLYHKAFAINLMKYVVQFFLTYNYNSLIIFTLFYEFCILLKINIKRRIILLFIRGIFDTFFNL